MTDFYVLCTFHHMNASLQKKIILVCSWNTVFGLQHGAMAIIFLPERHNFCHFDRNVIKLVHRSGSIPCFIGALSFQFSAHSDLDRLLPSLLVLCYYIIPNKQVLRNMSTLTSCEGVESIQIFMCIYTQMTINKK